MNTDYLFLFQFFASCIFGAMFLVICYWIFYEIKLRQRIKIANENLYNKRYLLLQDAIRDYDLNESNYKYLKSQLMFLGQMKFKNHEKTAVLTTEFFKRFSDFAKDEVIEHSPESVFGENDLY